VRLAALYDEHVAYADDALGRLLERLADLPSARDLLLVVTSDHGEAFLQHGAQGHNAQVYEEMLHVPLVVSGRGAAQLSSATVAEPVSLLDLLPTLVELCDLPRPRQSPQGRSLAGRLRGLPPDGAPRALFFSSRYKHDPAQLELAVREGHLKLVLSGATDRAALYDLARDPHERRDRTDELPGRARDLERRLRSWFAGRCAPAGEPAGAETTDPEALRALGYAGD